MKKKLESNYRNVQACSPQPWQARRLRAAAVCCKRTWSFSTCVVTAYVIVEQTIALYNLSYVGLTKLKPSRTLVHIYPSESSIKGDT